jgi:protein transport protein SEC61 subunit gamma and related proteins
MKLKEYLNRLVSFLKECKRVFIITKKPTNSEFKTVVKVSAIGMAIIGMIGFLINIMQKLLVVI